MASGKAGEWLQWRRDSGRTGHCPLKGNLSNPKIVAKTDLSCYEDMISIQPATGSSHLSLGNVMTPNFSEDEIRKEYQMDLYLDLEGTGELTKVEEGIMQRYLPKKNGRGYYRVRFEYVFDGDRWGDNNPTYGYLEERVNGKWMQIWRTDADPVAFWRPNILLTDINGDGEDEVVITEKGRLIAYDLGTGKKIRDLKYHDARNYGEYYAHDFTGNGFPDFVSIVHFPSHAEVLLNDGKEFTCAWYDKIQKTISDTDKLLATPYHPIFDLDQDGHDEIFFSRFNQDGDEKWKTNVLEPVSGAVKMSIEDFVCCQVLTDPVTGKPQLYGIRTHGNYINPEGEAAIYELQDGKPVCVFYDPELFWYRFYPRTPFSALIEKVKMAVLEDGSVFCGRKLHDEFYQVTLQRFENGKMTVFADTALPSPQFLQVVDGKALVSVIRSGPAEIEANDLQLDCLGTRRAKGKGCPPVVFHEDGKAYIALPNSINQWIYCYQYDTEHSAFRQVFRRQGYGMENHASLAVCRDHDKRRLVFGMKKTDATGSVYEVSPEGENLHEYPVPNLPAVTRNPVSAYLGYAGASWITLPFQDPEVDNLAVTSYRNNMHSGYTTAYDAFTKDVMWINEKFGNNCGENYGYGGERPFAGYANLDGTENLLSQYPAFQTIADGKTGALTRHFNSHVGTFFYYDPSGDVVKSGPALYSDPIVVRKPENVRTNLHYIQYFDVVDQLVLWGGSSFTLALWLNIWEESGAIWSTNYQYQRLNTPTQGVCDIDGDGYLEVLGYEHSKKLLTCRCLTSGELRWTMDVPNADVSRFYTTCDINGDGKDELILCTDRELLAIREENGKGKIVFTVEMPSSCQGAVVADADGDGLPEILLSCDNGCLYLLK